MIEKKCWEAYFPMNCDIILDWVVSDIWISFFIFSRLCFSLFPISSQMKKITIWSINSIEVPLILLVIDSSSDET